jgi:hypothetical protein
MKIFQRMFNDPQRTAARPTLRLIAAVMTAAAVSFSAASGEAQTIKNGGLTGVMVTRAARVNGASDVTFLTVPPAHFFILTQACFTTGTGTNLRLNGVGGEGGNQGGSLSEPQATLDNTECKEFTPGLVYQPGDAVQFRNNGIDLQRVYINGVMLNSRD